MTDGELRDSLKGAEVHELRYLIELLRERFDALRAADLEAIKVAREDVKDTMAGFPGEYARKSELEVIRDTAFRLDKTAMSREAYEAEHSRLEEDIQSLLSKEVFEATMREWTVWRRSVDQSLDERTGSAATWGRVLVLVGLSLTAFSTIIALIVLFATHVI